MVIEMNCQLFKCFGIFFTVFLFSISYEFLCDVSVAIQRYSSLGFVKESL